jgi:hypothetical protein
MTAQGADRGEGEPSFRSGIFEAASEEVAAPACYRAGQFKGQSMALELNGS